MECPVCFSLYDRVKNIAIKLSCAHTICRICLNHLEKCKVLSCPICLRKTFNIQDLNKCQTIENIILAKENQHAVETSQNKSKVSFIVRNLKGHVLEFSANKDDCVLKIKEMIQEAEKLPVGAQWLLLNGKPLKNDETLDDAGINELDIIYLVVRSFGG
jgi:hypothetical protein